MVDGHAQNDCSEAGVYDMLSYGLQDRDDKSTGVFDTEAVEMLVVFFL